MASLTWSKLKCSVTGLMLCRAAKSSIIRMVAGLPTGEELTDNWLNIIGIKFKSNGSVKDFNAANSLTGASLSNFAVSKHRHHRKTHGLNFDMKSGIELMMSNRQSSGNLTDGIVGLTISDMINMHTYI